MKYLYSVFISVFLLSIFRLGALEKEGIGEYLSLLQHYPHLKQQGKCLSGEFEIVLHPDRIRMVRDQEYKNLIRRGVPCDVAKRWSSPGIVASDKYLMWLRDPVVFPDGSTGFFKRIVWKCTLEEERPIAVLPISSDNRVYLIKIWRHATGAWELEIPRGAPNRKEAPEATARRELQEETGFVAERIVELGSVNPDSGILSTQVVVFAGFGDIRASTDTDEHESIEGVYSFSLQDLEEHIKRGYVEMACEGGVQKVFLRDPFLTYALYQIHIRRLA